ncbi:MAG: ATP-binding protein [Gemmatimonadaceae bacterium]
MLRTSLRHDADDGIPVPLTAAALVVLALVVWLSPSALRHVEGALIPWPTHGLGLTILVGASERSRRQVGVGVLVAVAVGGLLAGGALLRAIGSAALVAAQGLVILLIFQRLARRRHPLANATAYAWFMMAILVGVIPTALVAAAIVQLVGPELLGAYSIRNWWVAAVTSGAALAPVLLAFTAPTVVARKRPRLASLEFLALAAFYLLALLNAFLLVGEPVLALPPAVATLPFLSWAALRFGSRGFAIIAAMLITVVIASTVLGIGPFEVFGPEAFVRGQRAWMYLASLVGPAMIFPVALVEREAAEERARGAYAQLAAIIEGSGDLIAAVDRDLVFIAANPAWVEGFRRISDVTVRPGMRMEDAYVNLPGDAEESLAYWRRALGGEYFTVTRALGDPARVRDEYEITYGPVRDAHGDVVGASQVVRNVTARRHRDAEEAEARRLESVGRLAGGVAHDFNNLMTAVIGYAELIGNTFDKDDPRRADLAEIERAATRAGELTQQLLAFARQRVIAPQIVDIGVVVENFSRLLAPLLGPNITLLIRSEPGLRQVRLDPTQFEQVLMNLAVNARDAMPGGGRLAVETANAVRGATKGVRLTVRDSGTGMPPEVQGRAWEPFFTTKPLGQGTGLGLPTVHGIVHQAGGVIDVETKVGVGTAFHVFLPAVDES